MITDTPPYGPPDRVIDALEKYRETGLGGGPITTSLLTRLSMGGEVARRVLLSFKVLDLVDDEGNPTDHLRAFKQASSDEYKGQFASLLLDQYASVFAVLGRDLDSKSPNQIEDAFRTFRPDSLRKRQVSLFLGLCAYVGLIQSPPKDKPGPKAGSPPRRSPTPVKKQSAVARGQEKPLPPPPPPPDGHAVQATLESGGVVTLTVSVNVVDMSTTDRSFVFDLIDRVKGYGKRPALTTGSSSNGQGADE